MNNSNRVDEFVKIVTDNNDERGHIGYVKFGGKYYIDYVASDEFEFTERQWKQIKKELPDVLFWKE